MGAPKAVQTPVAAPQAIRSRSILRLLFIVRREMVEAITVPLGKKEEDGRSREM